MPYFKGSRLIRETSALFTNSDISIAREKNKCIKEHIKEESMRENYSANPNFISCE